MKNKKLFLTLILFFCFNHLLGQKQKIGAVQSLGEQGLRLATMVGKNTIFTGAKIGYDYRFKKWLQLSGEFLFDFARYGNTDSYTILLGFLPKYTIVSFLKSRMALNGGLGFYGANETLKNNLQEAYKNFWMYGFGLHGELDFYLSGRFLLFLAGKQFAFFNSGRAGIFRGYGELGFKIIF